MTDDRTSLLLILITRVSQNTGANVAAHVVDRTHVGDQARDGTHCWHGHAWSTRGCRNLSLGHLGQGLSCFIKPSVINFLTCTQAAIDRRMAEIDAEVEESRARFRARVMAVLCEDLDDEDELKVHAQQAYAAYVEAEQVVEVNRCGVHVSFTTTLCSTCRQFRPDDDGEAHKEQADVVAADVGPLEEAVDERSAAVAGWLALAPKVDGRSVPDTQIVERDFNWR